jgi:hypothetical protein
MEVKKITIYKHLKINTMKKSIFSIGSCRDDLRGLQQGR